MQAELNALEIAAQRSMMVTLTNSERIGPQTHDWDEITDSLLDKLIVGHENYGDLTDQTQQLLSIYDDFVRHGGDLGVEGFSVCPDFMDFVREIWYRNEICVRDIKTLELFNSDGGQEELRENFEQFYRQNGRWPTMQDQCLQDYLEEYLENAWEGFTIDEAYGYGSYTVEWFVYITLLNAGKSFRIIETDGLPFLEEAVDPDLYNTLLVVNDAQNLLIPEFSGMGFEDWLCEEGFGTKEDADYQATIKSILAIPLPPPRRAAIPEFAQYRVGT